MFAWPGYLFCGRDAVLHRGDSDTLMDGPLAVSVLQGEEKTEGNTKEER